MKIGLGVEVREGAGLVVGLVPMFSIATATSPGVVIDVEGRDRLSVPATPGSCA